MTWVLLSILAYFLDALVFVVDKYLLSHSIPHPSSYAFYVSVLNVVLVLLLLPFTYSFINILSGPLIIISLISGVSFFLGLLFLYQSIQAIDISEVMPVIGALSAIITFLLSWKFLPETISSLHFSAFFLLVVGTFLMSYLHISKRIILSVIGAALGLAVSYVSIKYVFLATGFINTLFWTRWGMVIAALVTIVVPRWRHQVFKFTPSASLSGSFIFVLNKILATFAFFLLYYAIKIGNVVFVNAIQGIQYVFMLIIGAVLFKAFPKLFQQHGRDFTPRRLTAMVLIVIGLVFLFV